MVLGLAGVLLPSACGDDEELGSSPGPTKDASVDVPQHDSSIPIDAGKDALGPPIRSVETRSRFGALDPGNYLLDGDFEYSGMDALQYPWLGVDYSWTITGARCHGGLRCIEVPPDQYILGVFVWPEAGSVDVEYFAKPDGTGTCVDEIAGLLFPVADYPGSPGFGEMAVMPTDAQPGPDGWCHVTANLSVPSNTGNNFWTLFLTPQQGATGAVLFDDASIKVPGGGSGGGSKARVVSSLTPALQKLVKRARADFAHRRPIPPRDEPARVQNRTARRKAI
jgi:hypothetical protein